LHLEWLTADVRKRTHVSKDNIRYKSLLFTFPLIPWLPRQPASWKLYSKWWSWTGHVWIC